MRERIVKGLWPIGTQISTLPALSVKFDVGLITIRQAVQLLKKSTFAQGSRKR
jgi:DNA-binding GntR family transcriptional regulator